MLQSNQNNMSFLTHIQAGIDAAKSHPLLLLAGTHAVTSAFFVWQISEGKPFAWIKKKVFQAALAVVPSNIIDAEQEKLRKTIESSVIGDSLEGEDAFSDLPEQGLYRHFLFLHRICFYCVSPSFRLKKRRITRTLGKVLG